MGNYFKELLLKKNTHKVPCQGQDSGGRGDYISKQWNIRWCTFIILLRFCLFPFPIFFSFSSFYFICIIIFLSCWEVFVLDFFLSFSFGPVSKREISLFDIILRFSFSPRVTNHMKTEVRKKNCNTECDELFFHKNSLGLGVYKNWQCLEEDTKQQCEAA